MMKWVTSMTPHKILITAHLWSTWLEVAIEHAEEARRARDEMTRLRAEGKEFALQLGSEFRASVVAVAASAHALDALYGSTVIPESARGHGQNRPGKIREALKRVFDTGPVNTPWVTQFCWLFDLRDAVVHAEEKPAPPVPHPAAGNTAAEHARYSVEVGRAGRGLRPVGLPVVCGPSAARRGKLGGCNAPAC